MAQPELKDGHTKIANELVEALARTNLSAYESRVMWCVLRKTYGWNKESDRISYSQFEEVTGMDRRHLGRTIKVLTERRMITCQGGGQRLEYAIQQDYGQWREVSNTHHKPLPKGGELLPKGATAEPRSTIAPLGNSGTGSNHCLRGHKPLPKGGELLPKGAMKPLPKGANTKAIKHITKALDKSIREFKLPEWLDKDTWEAFLEMRKVKKAIPTERAKELLIKELGALRLMGDDPTEVLNRSIMNSWKGVFPLDKRRKENAGEKDGEERQGFDPNKGLPISMRTKGHTPEEYRQDIAGHG